MTPKERIAAYIKRAQSAGSTATTLKGAGKYILPRVKASFRTPFTLVRTMPREAWKRHQRAVRLIRRYAGMARFPRYLDAGDRLTITSSKEHRDITKIRSVPLYAAAFFITPEVRAIPRLAGEIARYERAAGKLSTSPRVANDACCRWAGASDRRLIREAGECVLPHLVGVRTSGSNSDWSRRSTFRRMIDYSLICPVKHGAAWSMFYVAPDKTERKVFRTKNWLKIGGCEAQRIPAATKEPKPLPIHIQRRILEIAAPAALSIQYDRTAKLLMLVDALGEQYHLPPIATMEGARKQIRAGIAAMRKRRAEALIDIRDKAARVFVELEDSYQAGNCRPMSDRFAAEMWERIGAVGPCAVRADAILATRDDSFTRRACVYAASVRYA